MQASKRAPILTPTIRFSSSFKTVGLLNNVWVCVLTLINRITLIFIKFGANPSFSFSYQQSEVHYSTQGSWKILKNILYIPASLPHPPLTIHRILVCVMTKSFFFEPLKKGQKATRPIMLKAITLDFGFCCTASKYRVGLRHVIYTFLPGSKSYK